jgi:hypothetical protein
MGQKVFEMYSLPMPFRRQLPFLLLPGILIITGICTAVRSMDYGIGSFTRMGAGFAPMALGIALAILGVVIFLEAWKTSETWLPPAWRPFLAITIGILAWVGLVETTGLFIATFAQVIICSLALPSPRWRNVIMLAGILAVSGYALFVIQLGVPLEAIG